ncbi:Poly [ADP-ribose] polymerase tankyrase [Gryllus bimaculatus]|nr:Poly [ADP-ribose] polymerase tankyrase [Gryllus bimaculatus]
MLQRTNVSNPDPHKALFVLNILESKEYCTSNPIPSVIFIKTFKFSKIKDHKKTEDFNMDVSANFCDRMDVTFNNVLEGARQYFQGLPSPVTSNVDNPLYNSETSTSQPSVSGSETNSSNLTNSVATKHQKRDSVEGYPSKPQTQHYTSDQTSNPIPTARTAGQPTSVSRVANQPGGSTLATNIQSSKSVISVHGAIRSKRESPLDLSVKTVRQSADSTKDDVECGYSGSSVSPCGDVAAVGTVMQPLGSEATGGALPAVKHSPVVTGPQMEKAGGMQNTVRGVPLPKTDFNVNVGTHHTSRPIPTSSYSAENQRLSMLKPGVQQQAHLSFQSPATALPHSNNFRKSTVMNYNTCESREQTRDNPQYKYAAAKDISPYSMIPGVSSYENSIKQNNTLNRKAEYAGISAPTDIKHDDISAGHKRVHEGRPNFPAKIPRKDTWHRTIDQQIEQKLSAYTKLQHQEQAKQTHGTHSYGSDLIESSKFQNYQSPSLNSNFSAVHHEDASGTVHHNGIPKGSKQQYLPQLELNGDQHTIRKLLTSKSEPVVPSSSYSNAGSDNMLSILRNSLEIKEARISQLQNQLQQNAQLQHVHTPIPTNNVRSSAVMTQANTLHARQGMQSVVHSGSVAQSGHKLHVPKAVDSVSPDVEQLSPFSPTTIVPQGGPMEPATAYTPAVGQTPSSVLQPISSGEPLVTNGSSDSEGEMPVLERQTLYGMRRDRKLLTKVPSRCPVPSEATSATELESTLEPSAIVEDARDSRDLFVQGPASPSDAFWSSACDQFLEQLQAGSGTQKRGRKKKIIGDLNAESVGEKLAKDGTIGNSKTDETNVKNDDDSKIVCSATKAQESDESEIKFAETNGDFHSKVIVDTNIDNKSKQKDDPEEYQKIAKIKLEESEDIQRNRLSHLNRFSSKGELKHLKMCRSILKEEEEQKEESDLSKSVHEKPKGKEPDAKVSDEEQSKESVDNVGKEDVKATKESSSVVPLGRRRRWKRRKHFGRSIQHAENSNELMNREGKRTYRNDNKKTVDDRCSRMGGNRMKRKLKSSPRLNELKRLGKYKVLRRKGRKDDSEDDVPLSNKRLLVRKVTGKEERDVDDEMSLAEMKVRLRKGNLKKRPVCRKVLRHRADDTGSSSRSSSTTSESGDSSSDGVPQESVAARVHRRKGRNVAKTGMRLRPRNASSVPRNRKLCSQNSENNKKDTSSASQSESKQFDGPFHPGWEEEVYKFKQSLRMPAQLINIPKPPRARHISASLPDLDPSATLLDTAGSQNSASSHQQSVCNDQSSNSFGSQLPYKTDDGTESEDTNLSVVSSKNSSNIDNNNSVLNAFGQVGSNKYSSKRILQKKSNKGSIIPRSSSTDLDTSTPSETGGSQQILGGKLKKADLLKSEAKMSLSKIEFDNHDLLAKDRIKRRGREASNDRSKPPAENLVVKSRTRTQARLLQQRPTIRAVFGEDRPASAPPSCADTSSLLSESKRSSKMKKAIHPSVGVVTRGRAGLRTAAMLRSNKAVLNSKRHLLHSNKSRNMKLLRAIANKKITMDGANHFSSEQMARLPQGPHSAHINSSNPKTIGKRIKIRTVRRKFRSGFDYIRKKKKQQKKDTGDIETMKERKKTIVSRPSSESVQDVQAEIRGWVINKGLGETLLHRAARLGYTDVAAYCLEKMDSAPSPQDNAGYTPLHEACSRGHLDIARLLLMYGADVSASALGGVRPLHEAAENGYTELVRLLLSYGADPLLATYSGVAPLALATDEGSRWLLQHHLADVQGLSATSWTFHGAASCLDPVVSGYDPLQDPPCASPDTGEEDEIEFEISEVSLPVLYQLRGEPVKERWVLFQDLAPLLRVKSRDVLLRQISPGPGTDIRSILRELKMADFLEQAHCCHVLGVGEKVNIRASKVALVKYNDRVRELLGVEKITVSSR